MLNKTKLFGLLVIAVVMSSCGLSSCTPAEVTVREDNDEEWRLYDKDGNNQGTWIVDGGEEVIWVVTGSDMDFIFPEDMDTYFEYRDGLFAKVDSVEIEGQFEPKRVQRIAEGDSLHFKIKERKIEDDSDRRRPPVNQAIEYEIYVIDAEKYVVGNSPPYLIIRRSYN